MKSITKRVDNFDNIKKANFIDIYSRDEVRGNISISCDAVGISRQTYYNAIDNDEEFRKALYDAKMKMCDDMEQIAVSRAVDKSDTLLIFWLKYNHPNYKDQPPNVQINFNKILSNERQEFNI